MRSSSKSSHSYRNRSSCSVGGFISLINDILLSLLLLLLLLVVVVVVVVMVVVVVVVVVVVMEVDVVVVVVVVAVVMMAVLVVVVVLLLHKHVNRSSERSKRTATPAAVGPTLLFTYSVAILTHWCLLSQSPSRWPWKPSADWTSWSTMPESSERLSPCGPAASASTWFVSLFLSSFTPSPRAS